MREKCPDEPTMKIARRDLAEEEKNPTGVRKREARRSEDRVFPLIKEKPDENQRWGIVDEENVVRKYDFEGEMYVLDRRSRETQN